MPADTKRAFHVSLNVTNLARAVTFYEALFGIPPAKHHADYAKFEVEDPPLVLSLEPARRVAGSSLNHLGLRMTAPEALVDVQRRLEAHGYATLRENGVACCYAKQTKFWVRDPDARRWEVYVLEEDLEHHGAPAVSALVGRARYAQRLAVSRLCTLWTRARRVALPKGARP